MVVPLSVAALTNACKPHLSAIIFSDLKSPTGNSADYKHAAAEDFGRMGLVARTEGIFFGPPMGRSSNRTTTAVVAEINNDADRHLRLIVNGRPHAGSVIQAAENVGAIPLRDGSTHPTVKLLPFDDDAYGVFTFVESVPLVNEAPRLRGGSVARNRRSPHLCKPSGRSGCSSAISRYIFDRTPVTSTARSSSWATSTPTSSHARATTTARARP